MKRRIRKYRLLMVIIVCSLAGNINAETQLDTASQKEKNITEEKLVEKDNAYLKKPAESRKLETIESENTNKASIEREIKNDEKATGTEKEKDKKADIIAYCEIKALENHVAPINKEERTSLTKDKPMQDLSGMFFFMGCGMFMPTADYGERYGRTQLYSIGLGLYQYNFLGFSPEIHAGYSGLHSRQKSGRVDSALSLSQGSLGVVYRYYTGLPSPISKYSFFKRQMTLYCRITDGITRVSFESDNTNEPIVEYIHTLGLSAGFAYPVYENIYTGFDAGYQVIFTAVTPLTGYRIMFTVGMRL